MLTKEQYNIALREGWVWHRVWHPRNFSDFTASVFIVLIVFPTVGLVIAFVALFNLAKLVVLYASAFVVKMLFLPGGVAWLIGSERWERIPIEARMALWVWWFMILIGCVTTWMGSPREEMMLPRPVAAVNGCAVYHSGDGFKCVKTEKIKP